jgi:hypothetical protein
MNSGIGLGVRSRLGVVWEGKLLVDLALLSNLTGESGLTKSFIKNDGNAIGQV